jgi:sugar phosphate isomerase/epimerase
MGFPLSRRDFLVRTAAVSAVTALQGLPAWSPEGLAANPAAATSPVRLGVASYSFRKFGRSQVIEFMKQLDVPYLNVKDVHLAISTPEQIKQAADAYAAAGIKLTAAGTIYFTEDKDDDMRRKFEYCKIAGIPLIIAGPTPETLPRLEKFVKEYDIRIAIHNHGPEDKYFPSPLDALKAVKGMDPRMGVCIDVGHARRAGADIPDAIHKVGARLYDVHMKDLGDTSRKESQVPVGDGVLPIEKIFEALIAVNYPGYVDLEYEINEENPLPGMIKSFAYMRGVLAGMGYKA